MIRQFRNLCAKVRSRILPATKANASDIKSAVTVHRRVEVTLERESVAIQMSGQFPKGTSGAVHETGGTEEQCLESLPTQATILPTFAGATESPTRTGAKKSREGKS